MYTPTKTTPTLFLVLVLIAAAAAIPIAFAAPTVQTGKAYYDAGESLTVSGTADVGSIVSIQVFDPTGARKAIAQATAASDGSYTAAAIYTVAATDLQGTWTVQAYQGGVTAETVFTVGVAPPTGEMTLTISITPDQSAYAAGAILIAVKADRNLATASITVTQKGADPVALTVSPTVGDYSKWGGSYSVTTGADGGATIAAEVRGTDATTGSASKVFIVDNAAPTLTIEAEVDSTAESTVSVRGFVDEASVKTIVVGSTAGDLMEVPVTYGLWGPVDINLIEGANIIAAAGVDSAGNMAQATIGVTRTSAALTAIQSDLAKVKSDVSSIKSGLTSVRASLAAIDLSGVASSVDALKSDIASNLAAINAIDDEGIKSAVNTVKSDIAGVKSDVAGIDVGDVSTLQTYILVAVILSLIAALAAIAAVVSVRGMRVVK